MRPSIRPLGLLARQRPSAEAPPTRNPKTSALDPRGRRTRPRPSPTFFSFGRGEWQQRGCQVPDHGQQGA